MSTLKYVSLVWLYCNASMNACAALARTATHAALTGSAAVDAAGSLGRGGGARIGSSRRMDESAFARRCTRTVARAICALVSARVEAESRMRGAPRRLPLWRWMADARARREEDGRGDVGEGAGADARASASARSNRSAALAVAPVGVAGSERPRRGGKTPPLGIHPRVRAGCARARLFQDHRPRP